LLKRHSKSLGGVHEKARVKTKNAPCIKQAGFIKRRLFLHPRPGPSVRETGRNFIRMPVFHHLTTIPPASDNNLWFGKSFYAMGRLINLGLYLSEYEK